MAKIDKHHAGAAHPAHKGKAAGTHADQETKQEPKGPAALPGTWQHDFQAADKNHDGKLAKSEMKLPKAERKVYDADGNGTVTRAEYHAGHRQANSFTGLDANHDGDLDKTELDKLERFTKTSYDGDGDGKVSQAEFVAGRRTENQAIREARRDARYDALTAKDKQSLKRYDADGDGKISREEYGAGRDQDWKTAREAKIAENFAQAGGKDGMLKGAGAAAYKDYDADHDGAVSQDEFTAGQMADRKAYWASALTEGGPGKLVAKRLNLDSLGLGINHLEGKVPAAAPTDPTGTTSDPSAAKGDTDVTISSFNILGSSHTAPGGKEPGMASGPERMKGAVQLLKQHDVDIVGFQEMQGDQQRTFHKLAGDEYAMYSGSLRGHKDPNNTIAWRKDKWDLVKGDTVEIPYFNGQIRKMPYVLLRNKQTGQEAYFANFHNPADTAQFHHQEAHRDEATRREVALANQLRKTGKPLFLTGDMNEGNEYFGHMTKGSPGMHASASPNGRAPKKPGIDWIFGSPNVSFTRYVRDRGALVKRTTDHPMIISRARIRSQEG